jgi:four helix bundle protein
MMEDDRLNSFFRFEDLRIYEKVLSYIEWVYGITNLFPEIESTGGMASRFLNAAQNVAVAIAEGSGRNKPQFVQMLKDARGSVRECLVLGTIAYRLNFISEEKKEENREYLIEISKMLGALITSLQKPGRKNESRSEYEMERVID